jgi:tetratricopeptide (TPR) repeat protein
MPAGDAATHLESGRAALDSGDLGAAEQAYKNAVALDAGLAAAHLGLGNVYVRQNRLFEAEKAYQAALAIDPGMAGAHANLGVVYYQMGQFPRAIEQYEAALQDDPQDAETLYLLAALHLQQQDLRAAELLLLQAQELKPDLPEVYYGLGVLYKFKNQRAEAIAAFEKFLEIGPGQDPEAVRYAQAELDALKGQQ